VSTSQIQVHPKMSSALTSYVGIVPIVAGGHIPRFYIREIARNSETNIFWASLPPVEIQREKQEKKSMKPPTSTSYFPTHLTLHLSPRTWLGRRVRIRKHRTPLLPSRERDRYQVVLPLRLVEISAVRYRKIQESRQTQRTTTWKHWLFLTMVASKLPILLLVSLCSTSSIAYNLLDRPTLKVRKVNCPQYLLLCFFLYTYSYLTTAVWDGVEERKNRRPCCKSRKGWIPTHRHGMSATALQRGRGRRRLGCGCTGVEPR
jgi:hypothetical protein